MAKRKPGMVELAKQIGAMRNDGKVNWRKLAEHLAAEARPDLIAAEPIRRRGAPRGPWGDLFIDVQAIMRKRGCGVLAACKRLAKGEHPHQCTGMIDGKMTTLRIAAGNWNEKDPLNLEQRYWDHVSAWREAHDRDYVT